MLTAFTHIPKTGGTTLNHILRRYFGIGHLELLRGSNPMYGHENIKKDFFLNPFLRSISGHQLHVYSDWGSFANQMRWCTFVREPVSRFLSHYFHQVREKKSTLSFEEWVKRSPNMANFQVKWLAGREDLSAAKEILMHSYSAVGITERFETSVHP